MWTLKIFSQLYEYLWDDNILFLRVGRDIAEADSGEAGAGEVEGRDVGLHVADTAGVVVVILPGQHRHPTSGRQNVKTNIL